MFLDLSTYDIVDKDGPGRSRPRRGRTACEARKRSSRRRSCWRRRSSPTAEVALDEVVQAGRFVLYRDHADPHKYYYVPDAPRLATKRDGTPEFTFIKYTKTDGATKGGIIHFLVTWGMSEGELSSAESALRLKDAGGQDRRPRAVQGGDVQGRLGHGGRGRHLQPPDRRRGQGAHHARPEGGRIDRPDRGRGVAPLGVVQEPDLGHLGHVRPEVRRA